MKRRFWHTAFQRRIVVNASRIAMVVGTILNLINQGPALWGGAGVAWGQLLLNYLVPYCVATYSATLNELARRGEA